MLQPPVRLNLAGVWLLLDHIITTTNVYISRRVIPSCIFGIGQISARSPPQLGSPCRPDPVDQNAADQRQREDQLFDAMLRKNLVYHKRPAAAAFVIILRTPHL